MANENGTDTIANVAPVVTATDAKPAPKTGRILTQSKNAQKVNVARRQPIGDGDTATRSIEVVGAKLVKALYTFKLDEKSKLRYGVTTLLDYNGCTDNEILIDASRSHLITLQRQIRAMGDAALNADVYANVNVKRDLIEATRTVVDPETRDLYAFMRATGISDVDLARRTRDAIAAGTLKL